MGAGLGLWQVLFALAATLALLAGASWLGRRYLPALAARRRGALEVEILGARMLDPKHRLLLLGFEGRRYLVLLSPSGNCVVDRFVDGEGKGEAQSDR